MKNKNKKKIAAVLAVATALTGFTACKGGKKADELTEISWYLSGVKMDSSWDDVWDKVNELMEERYNLKLNINMIDGSNFSQKLQMMNVSQEAYDLTFTSSWANDYYTNVVNGSLLDLTDLLPEVTPTLWDSLTDAEKKGASVDGRIYAVPNWQVEAISAGLAFPTELLKKTGMSLDDFESIEDLEPYFAKVAQIDPQHNSQNGFGFGQYKNIKNFSSPAGCSGFATIDVNKQGKPEVFNVYETTEFLDFCNLMRDYVKKGYMSDVTDNKNYDGTGLIRTAAYNINYKPGVAIEMKNNKKLDVVAKQLGNAIMDRDLFVQTMEGVGSNSKHPEEALKVLEIMRTDKEIYNMLSFGLEGVDYEKKSDNIIKVNEASTYTIPNWSIGSVTNSYILDGNSEKLWEETKEFNDAAIVSPLLTFNLDSEPILSDIGNCQTVLKEYSESLEKGRVEDVKGTIAKLNAELKTAGIDRVLEEVQKQIDEWWASQK